MTANGKYSLLKRDNSTQMQLSQKIKSLSEFPSQRLKSSLNFEYFQNKMTLVADVFPILRTPKDGVKSISKKSRFRGRFENQDGKQVQILLKFERQHLYHIYWLLRGQFSCKKSLLVICKILRLFVKTVTADDKYSFLNRDSFTQPTQMQLSQKHDFFTESLSQRLNVSTKNDLLSWCVSGITDTEKRG